MRRERRGEDRRGEKREERRRKSGEDETESMRRKGMWGWEYSPWQSVITQLNSLPCTLSFSFYFPLAKGTKTAAGDRSCFITLQMFSKNFAEWQRSLELVSRPLRQSPAWESVGSRRVLMEVAVAVAMLSAAGSGDGGGQLLELLKKRQGRLRIKGWEGESEERMINDSGRLLLWNMVQRIRCAKWEVNRVEKQRNEVEVRNWRLPQCEYSQR